MTSYTFTSDREITSLIFDAAAATGMEPDEVCEAVTHRFAIAYDLQVWISPSEDADGVDVTVGDRHRAPGWVEGEVRRAIDALIAEHTEAAEEGLTEADTLDLAAAVELVTADVNAGSDETLSHRDAVAVARDTLRLPEAPPVMGAYPLSDDGTPLYHAYRAVLEASTFALEYACDELDS